MAIKVGINGFGRIGRVALRIMVERGSSSYQICGINLRNADLDYMVYQVKYDSVFRTFRDTVEHDDRHLIINGKKIRVYSESDASQIPWDDCGAEYIIESTGVFNTVEKASAHLQNGAKKVYAVDVGYGQLDWRLRSDARVVCMERTNARYLTHEQIPDELDFASVDVSFISLKLILPALAGLLKPDGHAVCLVKPQFEAGREKVGKKGVVRDPAVHLEVLEHFLEHAKESHFTVLGLTYSPIRGPEGNIEYLGYLSRAEDEPPVHDLKALVEASHAALEEKKGENDA